MKTWVPIMNEWLKYIINILVAAIAFFIAGQIQGTNAKLTEISKDVMSVKMEVLQVQSSMLTEDRVKELIQIELLKREQQKQHN